MKRRKKKNYKLRSKVYKGLGTTSIFINSFGGFFVYEYFKDWDDFKKMLQNFIIVEEKSLKLNFAVALPMLVGIIICVILVLKKNRSYFKDKISLGLLSTILICYFIYSIIEIALSFLVGAFTGAIADDFVFSPLSNSAKVKASEQREIELEKEKERYRLIARKEAREELDGSV
jgi:hypothetical protein